jgi:DNA invertase Pin-like site-specific DNA recombinase
MTTQKQQLELGTKTAIYARVSTQGQDLTAQVEELKNYCARKGWTDVVIFEEKVSGVSDTRPQLNKMLTACSKGDISRVVVYDLSRLSRKGVSEVISLIGDLQKQKVELISINEGLSFEGQMGLVMASMLSAFANIDYELRREKQKIGIQEKIKNNNGKCPWGGATRKRDASNDKIIHQMKRDGVSIRDISTRLKIAKSTVQKSLKELI